MKGVLLHGFFGKASDFDFLEQDFLYYPIGEVASKAEFKEAFLLWLKENAPSPCPLFAYSMGARIALELLLSCPELFSKAMLVSCHLGLQSEEEKKERLKNDLLWRDQFLTCPWDKLNTDWEAQKVFQGGFKRVDRHENDYSRKALGSQLVHFSLGNQSDLRAALAKNCVPITFVTGALDRLFDAMGKEAEQLNPHSTHVSFQNAGHRVPWDQPEGFRRLLASW